MTPRLARGKRGGGCDGVAAAKLADGGFTGDEEGTSVLAMISCID